MTAKEKVEVNTVKDWNKERKKERTKERKKQSEEERDKLVWILTLGM